MHTLSARILLGLALALALALATAAAACESPNLPTRLESLATEMCKCTDRDCLDRTNRAIERALQGTKTVGSEDADRVVQALKKSSQCAAKTAGTGQ
jgi:hypothetical protein